LKRKKTLDATGLWEYSMRCVAARAQTTGEIREKLRTRAERPDDIEPTIARLKEYGFLDDSKFAETFAAARLENQGFGKQRATQDLRRRRIAPALAERATEKIYAASDETDLIEAFLRRKYRNADREHLFEDQKSLASAYRRLRVAGFQSDKIIPVLKRFAADPDCLDGMEESPEGEV
jgi:regulatory protein